MNYTQQKAFQFIKNDFDINESIDFLTEFSSQEIEIFKSNFAIRVKLNASATLGTETGGTDDEVLYTLKNKYIEIEKIELWKNDHDDTEIEVNNHFRDELENILQNQINN